MVVRLRCSTPNDPTMASAKSSSPHIFRHCSTLQGLVRTFPPERHRGNSLFLFLDDWDGLRLAHLRGEEERLTHGRGLQVRVHLLDISSLSLEVRRERLAVDESVAGDNARALPLSQDIEQSGLRSNVRRIRSG